MRSERFFSICCGGSLLIKSRAQSSCWSCLDWRGDRGERKREEGKRGEGRREKGRGERRRGKGQRERDAEVKPHISVSGQTVLYPTLP